MRKITAFMITISMIFSLCAFQTFAEENIYEDADGIKYKYSINNDQVTILSIITKISYGYTVSIPSTIEGAQVTILGDGAAAESSRISKVIIPDTVVKIDVDAFNGCKNLKEVVFSEGLQTIEENAFRNCYSLKTINIPDTVVNIGSNSFKDCTGLTDLKIPDNIDSIGSSAFYGCVNLENVTWNKCVKNPKAGMFIDTKYLSETLDGLLLLNNDTYLSAYVGSEDFVIPDSVTEWGAIPFSHSTAKKITLPERFTSVPESFFFGMKNLTEVVFEGKIENVERSAFFGCESLKEITIPEGTKNIGPDAFSGCISLETVNLPGTIENICEGAFYNCKSLKNINLPNGLLTIENRAFEQCESLEEITIPTSILQLGNRAFYYCTSLKSVTIPANVAKVDAFYGSNNIENVTVTNGSIDPYTLHHTFKDTKWAQKTGKPKSETGFNIIDNELVEYDGDSRNPVIPEGVEIIGDHSFRGSDIDTVTIASTVKIIRAGAFMNSKIKEITIPSNVETVETQVFAWCRNLTKVTVEEGVKRLFGSVFFECTSLIPEEVNIAKGVSYSKEAFFNTPLDEDWVLANGTPKPSEEPEESQPPISPTASPKPSFSPTPEITPVPEIDVVSEDGEITLFTGDEEVDFPDAKPFIDENGRTQIPIRAVMEELDCVVTYDEGTQTVSVKGNNNDINITLMIGNNVMQSSRGNVIMDTAAKIINDRTYIPVRFVAEALGYTVNWEQMDI